MGDTSLYQNLLCNASFYRLLLQLDDDLAAEARRRGCACGDRLDSACYPRKPRGVPKELEDAYSCRHSFCCAKEGCRKRTTPPSFRFLGRKVFVGAVVVLVTVLRHGATPARMAQLRELVGVSRRTVERWREWWQRDFVQSAFWKAARGRLRAPLDPSRLPLSLLDAFCARAEKDRMVDLLRFLLPLTIAPRAQET